MYLHHRLSLVLLSFTVAGSAWAYPEYRVTVVGPANSWAYGINNAGVVVGDYPVGGDRRRAFLNRGKGLVDLGALKGVWSSASGINDRGEVVGNWRSADGRQRGFIYACGKARDIGTISGKVTGYSDINDAGYITASGRNPDTGETLGYLRAPNGAFTHLGAIPWDGSGAPETVPAAINNRNQITGRSGRFTTPEPGYRAFVWKNGVIRDLGDLGSTPNMGLAINDRGQITGQAFLPAGPRDSVAFLYSHGRMVGIDDRPATEYRYSAGAGINNRGHVVGISDHLSGFIWRGKRMESLNALIDPASGWDISYPVAINDAGQIAAVAGRNGVRYAVRLDLIRPHVDAAPALDPEARAELLAFPASPALEAALAKAEAQAQEREVARPVAQ
ncbi:HAF repeat-containing protein [Massilia sp. CFBP9012]|uniref:HAF repeat-containing protein n=1 Tax=Massilia sp. CFBP9012 TaxID=3096531 RepID=UPI002A6B1B0D|nr:HAF repeat-containing protein [Massilia sp. CFBP9012]MDY0978339.1 HAF repeat-containing protein [Massilia sp. CFBP9012]